MTAKHNKLISYTDGGARGNPGLAAIGVVLQDEHGKLVKEFGEAMGEATNNQAEYQAIIRALETAAELGASEVESYLDSELVVKQLNSEYKVKHANMKPLFEKVQALAGQFDKVSFAHVMREDNVRADELLNEVLDSL
ncbi:ribonuclease HI family protein [Patescibacteria group bacterium]